MTSSKPFSFHTITEFDDHIQRSIPNYDVLQETIIAISQFVMRPNSTVVDLGCSTGKLLRSLPVQGVKIGVDTATNLLPEDEEIVFLNQDIITLDWFHFRDVSLVTSIFTLQFIPKDFRLIVLRRIAEALNSEGCFLWAEKVVCESGWQQELMTFSHYDFKKKTFDASEILQKEQDLRPLMRCNTTRENLALAEEAGFKEPQLVWKFLNFECWLFRV